MLTYGVQLLHHNVRPHTATRTRALLVHLNWELFDHPPCSLDLAPSDYHMLTYLKNWLGSQRFNSNESTEGFKTWVSLQATDLFDTGIQKLISRYKCLNSGGDYVEKWLKYVCIFCINFFLIACFVSSSPEVTFPITLVLSVYTQQNYFLTHANGANKLA
jgi:hypothetical protein